ncbi:MAG: hypothetical protein HFF90_05885 [Oscillibacter sp.]|nr:hypothetical protein [Oscillibacter sp.]
MAKNPNAKSGSAKRGERSELLNGAMIFFLAGCVAEIYLFMIRRYYINGNVEQNLQWDDYLKTLTWVGLAVLAAGVVLSVLWNKYKGKRLIGWTVAGAGLFLGGASWFIRMYYIPAVTLLSVVVPVAMVLSILWAMYDRECSVSLTVLSASIIVVWVCRRLINHQVLGTPMRICAVLFLAALALLAWLTKKEKLGFLLPPNADPLPIYLACGLSVAGVVIALLSATVAYYAMWALAIIVFALAVYYTVKLL